MAVADQTSSAGAQRPTHTVAARLTDDQFVTADALRATFDPPSWSEAIRWLFDSPESRAVIGRRVRGEI